MNLRFFYNLNGAFIPFARRNRLSAMRVYSLLCLFFIASARLDQQLYASPVPVPAPVPVVVPVPVQVPVPEQQEADVEAEAEWCRSSMESWARALRHHLVYISQHETHFKQRPRMRTAALAGVLLVRDAVNALRVASCRNWHWRQLDALLLQVLGSLTLETGRVHTERERKRIDRARRKNDEEEKGADVLE